MGGMVPVRLVGRQPVSGPAMSDAVAAPSGLPGLSQTAGGTLAATTYYVVTTLVTVNGESLPSPENSFAASASNVLNVASPGVPVSPQGFSAPVTDYNVYVSTSSGTETKQNTLPVAIGTVWVEPVTGLVAGSALPAIDTAVVPGRSNPMGEVPAPVTQAGVGVQSSRNGLQWG